MVRRVQPGFPVLALGLVLLLSACLLAPGKFVSDLTVRKDGTFAFTYSGQLVILPLTEKPRAETPFEPQACRAEDSGEDRECTPAEIEEQKTDWKETRAARIENDKQQAESMKAFFGGIDPSDPKAAAELADRLRRQTGWNKVDYAGDGVFDVEFAIAGRLDHDFVFPTLERFPLANAFVQVGLRKDGTVRIDAPGFGPPEGATALGDLAQSAATENGPGSRKEGPPVIDGRFSIRTDAAILANNTDEGPQPDAAGQILSWSVTPRIHAAPTALLRLAP